jgi:hypothetical protein
VAERIERPLTKDEMKKIFEAGVARGLKQAKQEARINGGIFPPAHEMAMWCRERSQQLREKEQQFVKRYGCSLTSTSADSTAGRMAASHLPAHRRTDALTMGKGQCRMPCLPPRLNSLAGDPYLSNQSADEEAADQGLGQCCEHRRKTNRDVVAAMARGHDRVPDR